MHPAFSSSPPKVISFDCYGTLVQWYEVLSAQVADVLARRDAAHLDPIEVLTTFSRHSRRLETQKDHLLYKSILRQGFAAAFQEQGVAASADDVEQVAESIKTMGPHPDTVAALTRLKSRYRLAIFTNSDNDLIAHNLRLLGVPFDHVITAERARAYKPSHRLFEHAYHAMGVDRSETVHVAMGMDLDMQACHGLGVRAVWINRRGTQAVAAWKPYEELPDLRALPELLGA